MKPCARCRGQMFGELVYGLDSGSAGVKGTRWSCLQCGETYSEYVEQEPRPTFHYPSGQRRGRPPKAREARDG